MIYEDNQGAIEISKNPKHHNRTKHIDVSFHFTRERVSSKEITVVHCPTSDMIADVMTKAPGRVQFQKTKGSPWCKKNYHCLRYSSDIINKWEC